MDGQLLEFYRKIGTIRRDERVFRNGLFRLLSLTDEHIVYIREPFDDGSESVLVAASRKDELRLALPYGTAALCGGSICGCETVIHEGETGYFRLKTSVSAEIIK